MKYWLQIVGAVLIALSLIFMWQGVTKETHEGVVTLTANQHAWTSLVMLVGVGAIDIFLVIKKKKTISQWIHALFTKKVDIIIMVGILIYTWSLLGPIGFLPVMLGTIFGHLFWQG